MQTTQRTDTITIADDVNHLIKWLESEYPRGIDMYYVDYRDNLDERTDIIMELVRNDYSETLDESLFDYDLSYTFDEIEKNYINEHDEIDEISDELRDAMRDWCFDHDSSDYEGDLLRNTSAKLFFIDTGFEAYENGANLKELVKKFGQKNEKQIDAIKYITNEQFYHSTISFYFHADIADIIKALHRTDGDYITINGAMIGNVTRGNGSNWLDDRDVFNLVIPKKAFIANVYADDEQGTGYGWSTICGDWNRDGAVIGASKTRKRGHLYIESETSMTTINEREYVKTWNNGNGTCTRGDMNIERHETTEYVNEYPCGIHCKECGNFWID